MARIFGGPALGLGSLIVLLIVLEVVLRMAGPFLPGAYRTGPLIEPDPELGWRHVPSAVTWFRTPEFTVRAETNAQGRLGPVVTELKVAGSSRVMLLGDSFAGATQVPYERSMAALLPGMIGRDRQVDVVNEGVSGYGTDQELLAFERSAPALGPDIAVLLFTVSNDVWNNDWALESQHPTHPKPHFRTTGDGRLELVRPPANVRGTERLRSILARSWLMTVLKTAIVDPLTVRDRDLGHRRRQLDVLDQPSAEWQNAWSITDALIERFGRIAASLPTAPVLVIAPDACQVHQDLCSGASHLSSSTYPQDRLRRAGAAAGIVVVDLLPAFRDAAAQGDVLYFTNDLHWTVAGQRLAAEVAGAAIRRLLTGP